MFFLIIVNSFSIYTWLRLAPLRTMMTSNVGRATPLNLNKYKISRRGRKLQISDDQRTLIALPRDVPERTWAEILQKEENELVVLDVREELLEQALRIGYEHYMEKQNALFTAHCAAKAWIKLIDWCFYRHDPGEDPSAYPPCFIPKRLESWEPDEIPAPSPKDTWGRQNLNVIEDQTTEGGLQKWPSSSSIDMPVIEEIPQEYWFPGKVFVPEPPDEDYNESSYDLATGKRRQRPRVAKTTVSGVWVSVGSEGSEGESPPSDLAADSELLQKVTDYSTAELSPKESMLSALKTTTPVEGSVHGAGDSMLQRGGRNKRSSIQKRGGGFSRPSMLSGKSKSGLPPIKPGDSRSRISVISDCRLRNLRLDTQYEVSSEKVDTPPGEIVKRKA